MGQRPDHVKPPAYLSQNPPVPQPEAKPEAKPESKAEGEGAWRLPLAPAYDELIERGAEPVDVETGVMELYIPTIRGIGGAIARA